MAQAGVRFAGDTLQQRRRKPRFADPGLAGKQHHLAFAGLRLRPAPLQQFDFFFTSHERGQIARVQGLETALHRTRPQRRPDPHRPGDALEVHGSKILKLEKIAEQFSRPLGDDHLVWLGDRLQPRGQIGRFADDSALLRVARSNEVADHDQPGRNTDPGSQSGRRLERGYRRGQLQSRPYRALGVVLVRLRVAEIYEDTVAEIVRDEPAKAAYALGDAFLIGRDDLTQVFRVHACRERRRADQVREHHGNLAALRGILGGGVCHRQSARRRRFRVGPQERNSVEQLAPVPDNIDA
jgi:hypothetical protein